jgi:hypothetical protein
MSAANHQHKALIALMKTKFTFLVLSMLLCGCSKEPTTPAQSSSKPARDLIVAGEDLKWNGDVGAYILHVAKRDGDSLEGISATHIDPPGKQTMKELSIAAARATIKPGSTTMRQDSVLVSTNVVTLLLQDVQLKNRNGTTQFLKEYSLPLYP